MALNFVKMHGLGNDFVVLDGRAAPVSLQKDQIIHIADRQRGIGCDQLILLEPPTQAGADLFMRIYNPDASQAGACGNATRCVADLLMNQKGGQECVIQTLAGLLYCTRDKSGVITVDMGVPKVEWSEIPILYQCDTLNMPVGNGCMFIKDGPVGVNVGNPHAVFFVDDVEGFPVAEVGPEIENNPFFPEKANIEFAKVIDRSNIRMRVWERNAGETQACGSASCAAVVAGVRRGYVDRRCNVILNGGTLNLYWREADSHLFMTGPVAYVFEGRMLFD